MIEALFASLFSLAINLLFGLLCSVLNMAPRYQSKQALVCVGYFGRQALVIVIVILVIAGRLPYLLIIKYLNEIK